MYLSVATALEAPVGTSLGQLSVVATTATEQLYYYSCGVVVLSLFVPAVATALLSLSVAYLPAVGTTLTCPPSRQLVKETLTRYTNMSIAAKSLGGRISEAEEAAAAAAAEQLAAKKGVCSQRQAAANAEQQLHSTYYLLWWWCCLSLSPIYLPSRQTQKNHECLCLSLPKLSAAKAQL